MLGPTVRVKLKSGGDGAGGAIVVLELTALDAVEDVAAALEDAEVLDVEVVLTEGAFWEGLG